jgi:hypothetical protein
MHQKQPLSNLKNSPPSAGRFTPAAENELLSKLPVNMFPSTKESWRLRNQIQNTIRFILNMKSDKNLNILGSLIPVT